MTGRLLQVELLTLRYGGVVALDDVSFGVAGGEVLGLIGPNGAGKTSLIDVLTGATDPTAGTVVFDGKDVTGLRPHRLARRGLCRTFQSVELFDDLTVEENLMAASEDVTLRSALIDMVLPARGDRSNVDWALDACGLSGIAARRPGDLSHGQRKLVGVARALARRPALVLMDEPAAGLDTDESRELGRHLRRLPEQGVTVFLVDHDMSLVLSVCDRVLVLDFGHLIAEGTPDEIRADQKVIDAYLGAHAEPGASGG